MKNLQFIDNLISFGLTRQEATIYTALLTHGDMTGYEVSKETGISRSNAYAALSNLVLLLFRFLIYTKKEGENFHPFSASSSPQICARMY